MNSPEDVSGLKEKIEDGEIKSKNIAAIMCMTEGDNFEGLCYYGIFSFAIQRTWSSTGRSGK